MVATGNITNDALLALVEAHLEAIVATFDDADFLELGPEALLVHERRHDPGDEAEAADCTVAAASSGPGVKHCMARRGLTNGADCAPLTSPVGPSRPSDAPRCVARSAHFGCESARSHGSTPPSRRWSRATPPPPGARSAPSSAASCKSPCSTRRWQPTPSASSTASSSPRARLALATAGCNVQRAQVQGHLAEQNLD